MIFLNNTDFLTVIDSTTLNTVIGNDDNLLNEVELMAIEEMNAYLDVRYAIALCFDADNRNASVVMYLTDMVLYHLHSRIAPDNIPELRHNRYKSAMDWLEKVADGFIKPSLPTKETSNSTPIRYGNSNTKRENYF